MKKVFLKSNPRVESHEDYLIEEESEDFNANGLTQESCSSTITLEGDVNIPVMPCNFRAKQMP